MGVRRQNMHQALIEEALGPVLGRGAKTPREGASRDLNPGALLGGVDEPGVVRVIHPGQPFRVGDDGHVAGRQDIEDEVLKAGGTV